MVYVTADLHGISVDRLKALLRRAGFTREDTLFVLGDSLDRGEHGVELLLYMMNQPNIIHLLGNHEAMLLSVSDLLFDSITDQSLSKLTAEKMDVLSTMLFNGGQPTLNSLKQYARRSPETLELLVDYLQDMPLYDGVTVNGFHYLLVHAGLGNFRPGKALEEYTEQELLWHRPELTEQYTFLRPNTMVLCGHTPTGYYGTPGRIVRTATWCCIDTSDACPMVLRLDDWAEFYE